MMGRTVGQQAAAFTAAIDMELISQRVLKLAEIAMLDHLEAIERSQATGLTADSSHLGNLGAGCALPQARH